MSSTRAAATRSGNIGPLTKAVALPTSCTSVWASTTTDSKASLGVQCVDPSGLQDDFNCWPPIGVANALRTSPFYAGGFYSPGLLCPTGYTEACRATQGSAGGFGFNFTLQPSETAVGCCPSGYTCAYATETLNGGFNTVYQACQQAGTSTITINACQNGVALRAMFPYTDSAHTGWPFPVPVSALPATPLILTTGQTYRLTAHLFQLIHQPSDTDTTSSDTTSSGTITSSSTLVTAATSVTSISTSSSASSTGSQLSSSISTSAKAGIGVGVAVGALALGALAVLYFRWRKRKRTTDDAEPFAKAELEQPDNRANTPTAELPDRNPGEVDGEGIKLEMMGMNQREPVELEGSGVPEMQGTMVRK